MTTSKEEALQARIDELEARIAANRTTPEFSSVFVNTKTGEPLLWDSLSETKRHLEKEGVLDPIRVKAASETLTSEQFHNSLTSILRELI